MLYFINNILAGLLSLLASYGRVITLLTKILVDPKGIEPLASTLQVSRSSQLSYGPIILRREKLTLLTFPLSFTLFSLSNYGVAVFSPTKHYSYRGNVTSAQLFNSYTSTVIG